MAILSSTWLSISSVNPSKSPALVASYRKSRQSIAYCQVREWSVTTLPTPAFKLFEYNHVNGPTTFPINFGEGQEENVEIIRHMLISTQEKDPMEILIFVDKIQRIGVNHHFQEQIDKILRKHVDTTTYDKNHTTSLHDVSLSFRLLRQHGYDISSDTLKKFTVGKFKERKQVIRGLVELYEAAQLSFEGEHELFEAANLSSQILSEHFADMDYNLSTVSFRLLHPCHKSLSGLTQRHIIQNSANLKELDKALKELAVIDIRERRSVYQLELYQISKWWNELGISTELELARNQPLKWYAWSMAALMDDLSLSKTRVELTKCIAFIYLIDDIFDLYGMIDELNIFAEAVAKWDYAAMETLPDYMKTSYRALLDTTNEIAHDIQRNHGYNPIDSLKATWASLCYAFLKEAKWFASGEMPTSENYLENGIVSSGVHVVLVHLFFLLGLGGTLSVAIELEDISELVRSVATIVRLWDDLGSAKDEHQDGKDGSYIEFFMQEHRSITTEQAREHVMELIGSAWRRLNKECLPLNSALTRPFQNASLNLARMVPLMYEYDANHKLPVLNDYVKFMLFNEIS